MKSFLENKEKKRQILSILELPYPCDQAPPKVYIECYADDELYYYDAQNNRCLIALDGGCGELSANVFGSLEECENLCVQDEGIFS